jgi:hypothetical protein
MMSWLVAHALACRGELQFAVPASEARLWPFRMACGHNGDYQRASGGRPERPPQARRLPHDDNFFQLSSGRVSPAKSSRNSRTYRRRLAILGEISRHVAESSAFRDFVYEANRGDHVWFVADLEELDQRLAPPPGPPAQV